MHSTLTYWLRAFTMTVQVLFKLLAHSPPAFSLFTAITLLFSTMNTYRSMYIILQYVLLLCCAVEIYASILHVTLCNALTRLLYILTDFAWSFLSLNWYQLYCMQCRWFHSQFRFMDLIHLESSNRYSVFFFFLF